MILYRAVGLQELALIYDSGMKAFPTGLPQQPIFYPVLQLDYARQIAVEWNTKSGQSAGYVTQFKVEEPYISQFEKHAAGTSEHRELWIPAEGLDEFNKHIVGHIKVLEAYFGDAFEGFVPDKFGLQGQKAVEQFNLLANAYIYKRMDFFLEIKRNHKAVFLNYPFWQTHDFKNPGLKGKILQAIKEAWLTSFPQFPLPLPPAIAPEAARVEPTGPAALADPVEDDIASIEQTDAASEVEPVDEEIAQVKDTRSSIEPVEQTAGQGLAKRVSDKAAHSRPTGSHFVQGIRLGLNGQYHEARDELSRAVEEDPGHVVAHTSLGVVFHRLGEDRRALDCYESALKLDPIYAEAHYFRANILYGQGNVHEALAGYTMAIGLQPELIQAHQERMPQDRLTDYTSAPAEMYWIARPAHRILELSNLLRSNPEQAKLLKERAAEYYRLRNYARAIADYNSFLALQPDDAATLHLRGVAYEQLGQSDRALQDYQRAMAIEPQLSNVYIDRGITFGKMGNYRQSVASLTEAIRLAPRSPDGYFNRGSSYFQLGNLEAAIADFSTAIRLSPHDEDGYYWRGVANEAAGHQQAAMADYRQFLAISQNPGARDEIEQKLIRWSNEARRDSGIQSRPQTTDRGQPETEVQELDLHGLLAALGERARAATWYVTGVRCAGEKAEELYALSEQNEPIAGSDFLEITAGIGETREGDFQALDPGASSPWIFIRAWNGTGFYIETDDPEIKARLQAHFPAIQEVEGADPPYESLFIQT